jgi:hypothetical protein
MRSAEIGERNVSGTCASDYFDRVKLRPKVCAETGAPRVPLQLPTDVVRAGAGLLRDIGYLKP